MPIETTENLQKALEPFAGGQLNILLCNRPEELQYRGEITMPRVAGDWLDIRFNWAAQLDRASRKWRKTDTEPLFELELKHITHMTPAPDGLLEIASVRMEQVLLFFPPEHKEILPDIFVEGLHPLGYVGDFPKKLEEVPLEKLVDWIKNRRMIPHDIFRLITNEYQSRGPHLPA